MFSSDVNYFYPVGFLRGGVRAKASLHCSFEATSGANQQSDAFDLQLVRLNNGIHLFIACPFSQRSSFFCQRLNDVQPILAGVREHNTLRKL